MAGEDKTVKEFLGTHELAPKAKNIYLDSEWYRANIARTFEVYKKPKDPKNPQSNEQYAAVQREKLEKKLGELFDGDIDAFVKKYEADASVINVDIPERELTPTGKYIFERRPQRGFADYPKLSEYKGEVIEAPPNFLERELRPGLAMVARDAVPTFKGGIILDGNFGYDEKGEPVRPDDKIIIDHHDKFDTKTHDTATGMAFRMIEDPEGLAKLSDPRYLDENGKLVVMTNNIDSDSILSTFAVCNREKLLEMRESDKDGYLRLKNIMYEITRSGDFLLGGNTLDHGATPRDYEYIMRGYIKACQQQIREGRGDADNPKASRMSPEDNTRILNHMHEVVTDIIQNPFKYQKFLKEGRSEESAAIGQVDAAYRAGEIEITPDAKDKDILFVRPLKGKTIPNFASLDGEYFFYRGREDFNRELIVKTEKDSFMMAINTQNMKGLEKYDFNKLIDAMRAKEAGVIESLIGGKSAELQGLDPKRDAKRIKEINKELKALESDKQKNAKGQLWRSRTQMIFAFKTYIPEQELMENVYDWKK